MSRELVDGFFEGSGLFRGSTLAGGKLGALFVFNLIRSQCQTRKPQKKKTRKENKLGKLTAISKSTIFSANVDISLLKQNLYSPGLWAVKTKSPWRSFVPSRMVFSLGERTE